MRTPFLIVGLLSALLGANPVLADDNDRQMVITNESTTDVVEFYASAVAAETWEEDILGDKILRSGQAGNFTLDDGSGACLFDFRFVFEDGSISEAEAVNVCKIGRYFIRD